MSDIRHVRSSAPSDPEEGTLEVSAPDGGLGEVAVGATISRYVVLEEVGRGGMGRVARAYDPKLQREVALKEVRAEVLDEESTQRLVFEARAMAKLSHPNVVGVYDVEELESGAVVVVMEYVAGQTLRQWLRSQQRMWKDIVARFIEGGRGLAAAHQAGLLHRDFKASNVLVAQDGGIKVTDFGLAKPSAQGSSSGSASHAGDSSQEELTAAGTVLGTPRYMAPEQHRGEALGESADQYALCVALWEALCGDPPFAGKAMAVRKESGPPTWPRGRAPRRISRAVVRGLSPRPADRWPSMQALLDALSGDPVRHHSRWLLGLASVGAVGVAMVAWGGWADSSAQRCAGAEQQLVGVWDDARRAEVRSAILAVEAPYAPQVWERTQRELNHYGEAWAEMHTAACEATTVRGEQSTRAMDLRMACLHRAAVDLQAAVDQLGDADEEVVRRAHKLIAGLRPLSRCADVDALLEAVEPPAPEEDEAVEGIRAQLAEAKAQSAAGRYAQAREVLEAARKALVTVEYRPIATEVALQEGFVLDYLGEYADAEASLAEAVKYAARWRQWAELGVAARKLMHVVGVRQQRVEQGLRYAKLAEGLAAGDPQREAAMANALGFILHTQGKYEEAEAEHRRALELLTTVLAPDDLQVAAFRNNIANALYSRGMHEEAEAEHRRVLALREAALGPQHPQVAGSRSNLANALYEQGKYEEAEAEHRRALALRQTGLPSDHPDIAASRNNLATVLMNQAKHAEAEAELRAALGPLEKALGREHPRVALTRDNLANSLHAQGRYAEAEVEHRGALVILHEALGPDHPRLAASRFNLAGALHAQSKYEEAEAEFRQVLAVQETSLGPDHPQLAAARYHLAKLLLERGRPAEALPFAEQAWTRDKRDDVPTMARARTAFALAVALWEVHRTHPERARARRLAERALREWQATGDVSADDVQLIQRWLGRHRVR